MRPESADVGMIPIWRLGLSSHGRLSCLNWGRFPGRLTRHDFSDSAAAEQLRDGLNSVISFSAKVGGPAHPDRLADEPDELSSTTTRPIDRPMGIPRYASNSSGGTHYASLLLINPPRHFFTAPCACLYSRAISLHRAGRGIRHLVADRWGYFRRLGEA